MIYIVGLGNPGEEYELTRHNTGRMVVQALAKDKKFKNFEFDKKMNALVSEGKIVKEKVMLILPETFMNNSGKALQKLITSKKKAESLVVVHDDIDLASGKFKISFGKGSAGHRGVESVMRIVKTKDFTRIRVGTVPRRGGVGGKLKKPQGEKLLDFLMGKFKSKELAELKKVIKKIIPALEAVLNRDGLK